MAGLAELARSRTALDERSIDCLHRLVAGWLPLADLSFADLLLYAPCRGAGPEPEAFVVLAHVRANTGPTVHVADPVGAEVPVAGRAWLRAAISDSEAGQADIVQEGAGAGIGEDAAADDQQKAEQRQDRQERQERQEQEQRQEREERDQRQERRQRQERQEREQRQEQQEQAGPPPVRRRLVADYVPVLCAGAPIAVLARESAPAPTRQVNPLEAVYRSLYDRFARMVADGALPYDRVEQMGEFREPRVGDGVMVFDYEGRIAYASPNATSALHRLGVNQTLPGCRLADLGLDETVIRRSFWHRRSTVAEYDLSSRITVVMRAFPLVADDRITGAVALVRDISELRHRDRLLVSKDATIREIHHRVKNNLQTVSALLRLQARRLDSAEAKTAVESSVRRVSSIAMVHEHLALDTTGAVNFDAIVKPLVRMVEEGLTAAEQPLRIRVTGAAGEIDGDVAMPLAVVLTELVQNAFDHAGPAVGGGAGPAPEPAGEVVAVRFDRTADTLSMRITDSGPGVPEGFSLDRDAGLGLTIVRTFVVHDLGGRITIRAASGREPRGAVVDVTVPRQRPSFSVG